MWFWTIVLAKTLSLTNIQKIVIPGTSGKHVCIDPTTRFVKTSTKNSFISSGTQSCVQLGVLRGRV